MIVQRLILIDPPEGTIGLDPIAKVWACAGCRQVITSEDGGSVIAHPDDCPEMARASRSAEAKLAAIRAWIKLEDYPGQPRTLLGILYGTEGAT